MEPLYEYTQRCREERTKTNEDELIQILSDCLDNGADIDFIFPQKDRDFENCHGTILHYSIINRQEQVVEYALSRRANIAVEMISDVKPSRYRSALDLAFLSSSLIREIIKKRSLELYSSFGLTAFHLACTVEYSWKITAAQVNAAISPKSPIWPLMTPILIAAKFENRGAVRSLLDLGADPIARDAEGNTPLHYIIDSYTDGHYDDDDGYFFDERLFALDAATDTFGYFTGESHFHIACRYCYLNPKALDIVKRYLEQGISPDLPIRSLGCEIDPYAGQVGLHIAARIGSPELIQLLLEYGADVDKQDSKGYSPMAYCNAIMNSKGIFIKCICLFIEGGLNIRKISIDRLLHFLLNMHALDKQMYLSCIKRLISLSKSLVYPELMNVYPEILKKSGGWNEAEYARRCSEELTTLVGLRKILDDSIVVRADFKNEFGWLDSFDLKVYPIYGRLLKIKAKRKLIEFEKKKEKISEAIPLVQSLFQSISHLPDLCAENILWNLSYKELDELLAQFGNGT